MHVRGGFRPNGPLTTLRVSKPRMVLSRPALCLAASFQGTTWSQYYNVTLSGAGSAIVPRRCRTVGEQLSKRSADLDRAGSEVLTSIRNPGLN